jgi:predicted O-methyltransferase YrrM
MQKPFAALLRKIPYFNELFPELERCRRESDERQLEASRDREQNERLSAEIESCRAELARYRTWVPPGHFSSPIPAPDEVRLHEKEIYSIPRTMPGLDLRERQQLELFDRLLQYYDELPFPDQKSEGRRYWFENLAYSYSDAIFLFCMMRYARPRRVIEVGSGYSSCAILDTNELFFGNSIACTFIEPHPALLLSLIRESDSERIRVIEKQVQETELELFETLEAGDILFIDSSHVSKVNSDVNHLFFKVLPVLQSGVYIHFHDIFYPFEYPLDWVYEGRAWNEAYVLRAFLQYNRQFEIQIFNTFIDWFHKEKYFREMPLVMKNTGGSIWLKKV